MFKYKINKIKLFGYHGVYKNEIENGQYFYIDVEYGCEKNIDVDDQINRVIDYSEIVKFVEFVFNSKRFNLLETLILNIKDYLKVKYPEINFLIRIYKKNPQTEVSIDSIEVECK